MSHGSARTGSKPSKASRRKSPSSASSMSALDSSSPPLDDEVSKELESCEDVNEQTETSGRVHGSEELEVKASVIFTAGRKLTWFPEGYQRLRDHALSFGSRDHLNYMLIPLFNFLLVPILHVIEAENFLRVGRKIRCEFWSRRDRGSWGHDRGW